MKLTVKELRKMLSNFDDNVEIAVCQGNSGKYHGANADGLRFVLLVEDEDGLEFVPEDFPADDAKLYLTIE